MTAPTRQAVFITGFSNWGKSTIIEHQKLFNRKPFYFGKTYRIIGVNSNFLVESHSNDDYIGQKWVDLIDDRIAEVNKHKIADWNLFTALCPSMEPSNNFVTLLNNSTFDDFHKHLFLIKYKWEHHAQLIIKNIENETAHINNVTIHVIDQDRNIVDYDDRTIAKTDEIHGILQNIFP